MFFQSNNSPNAASDTVQYDYVNGTHDPMVGEAALNYRAPHMAPVILNIY